MKKFFLLPLAVFLVLPVFANTTRTTTTRTYDSSIHSPLMGTERDSEMIEGEEEFHDSNLNQRDLEQQRMEDQWHNDIIEEERMEEREEPINYNDRTRTDRERKALNTSSNASDDQ